MIVSVTQCDSAIKGLVSQYDSAIEGLIPVPFLSYPLGH